MVLLRKHLAHQSELKMANRTTYHAPQAHFREGVGRFAAAAVRARQPAADEPFQSARIRPADKGMQHEAAAKLGALLHG